MNNRVLVDMIGHRFNALDGRRTVGRHGWKHQATNPGIDLRRRSGKRVRVVVDVADGTNLARSIDVFILRAPPFALSGFSFELLAFLPRLFGDDAALSRWRFARYQFA